MRYKIQIDHPGCSECEIPQVWEFYPLEDGFGGHMLDDNGETDFHMPYFADPVYNLWDLLASLAFCYVEGEEHPCAINPLVENDLYGHCDTCGTPCDDSGCILNRDHVAAILG